jgi:site-specific recombinase XerD
MGSRLRLDARLKGCKAACPIWVQGSLRGDAEARHLSKSTISKQKNVLEKRLLAWCAAEGVRLLRQLDVDAVRRFQATWPDATITASRNLERLRNFFRFWHDAGWIDKNPAKAVRPPKVTQSPTLPLEPEQIEQMLAACETYTGTRLNSSQGSRSLS